MKSWKTTVSGLLAALTVIFGQVTNLFDGDSNTVADWNIVIATVMTAIGLFNSRDNNVSSEEAGAK